MYWSVFLSRVKFCLSSIAGLFLYVEPVIADTGDVELTRLYGDEIHFDVYRNGAQVGHHFVKFSNDFGSLEVHSKFEMKIDFLFFNAFHFKYNSEARGVGGALEHLKVHVSDDGQKFQMTAVRHDKSIEVASLNGNYTTPVPVFPTNHWNVSVLNQTRVLNTLTGRMNEVKITARALEVVHTEIGSVQATRYVYSGDLDNEVWYDQQGRWVKMRFKARDNSVIDYICRRCQGKSVDRAKQ